MQAVILAAGKSSRMYPLNGFMHKSLIPICGKTILQHTIESIKKSGITDIIIVVSDIEAVKKVIVDGKNQGLSITFVQMEEPTGSGDALLLSEKHISGDFFLLNSSRIDFHEFKVMMEEKFQSADGVLLGCHAEDVEKYGILQIENERVTGLVEKPTKESAPSNIRIVGLYLLKKSFLETLKATPKDHYSLEHALSSFLTSYTLHVAITQSTPASEKYAWDLLELKKYLLEQQKPFIAETAVIAKSAVVEKNVTIAENAHVMEGAVVKDHSYIGKNSTVGTNAIVRSYSSVEEHAVVGAQMEMKNTLLLSHATTHSGFIGDSVIGERSKIAAGFHTGNVRLDRKPVTVSLSDKKINTGLKSLGVIMGDDVKIGIRVSTMPGILIGKNTLIGSSTTVMKNIPENAKYYTTFKEEVMEKKSQTPSRDTEKIVLFDIDYTLFDTGAFKTSNLKSYAMYEEVEDVLKKLQGITIGIFSEGQLAFQNAKLIETNTHKHFSKEHIHITEKKEMALPDLIKQYKDSALYLVDDKLPILYAAKKINPFITTIWVKRGIFAEKQEPIEGFLPDATVENLRAIIAIIVG